MSVHIMSMRVFITYDYARDFWRVSEIKNFWDINQARELAGLIEPSAWETLALQGDNAVRRWIRNQLLGTSVTVVLIGAQTSVKEYVNFAIVLSHEQKNGLLGIYIHNIEDSNGHKDYAGKNPFDNCHDPDSGLLLSHIYPSFDWIEDNGYDNFGQWINIAAALAGK